MRKATWLGRTVALVAAAALAASSALAQATGKHANVIVLMTDDVGWGDPNGADIPEFVSPDVLTGKYPDMPDAVKNMKLHPPKP